MIQPPAPHVPTRTGFLTSRPLFRFLPILLFTLTLFACIPTSTQAGAPTGACCSPTGVCLVTTEAVCDAGGREYQGDGTTCDPNPCEALTGACCFPDFSCLILEIDECAAAWGIFAGDGVPCEPTPCTEPIGACCLVGDLCAMSNQTNCFNGDGDYQGHGTSCATFPCDPTASVGDGRNPDADLAATGIYFSLPRPNPASGPVRFDLELLAAGYVQLQTLDAIGRVLREETLSFEAGRHAWTWRPEDATGRPVSAGVYFIHATVSGMDAQKDGAMTRSATRSILVTK